jgi:hypothetical protein
MCFRARAKLQNAAPGYISSHFFLRCLYEEDHGDICYPLDGFLKAPLLIHVSLLCNPPLLHPSVTRFVLGISAYLYIANFCNQREC